MDKDPTEAKRIELAEQINGNPREREELEAKFGEVWDTEQLKATFQVHGFLAPFTGVTRKEDGVKGSLLFQHWPRYYFGFTRDDEL